MSRSIKWFGLIACALVVAVVAAILDSDALYFLVGFLAMMPVAARIFGAVSLQSLVVEAGAHPPVLSGESVELPIQLWNPGVFPRFYIKVGLVLPGGLTAATGAGPWEATAALPPRVDLPNTSPTPWIDEDRPDIATDTVSVVGAHGRGIARCRIKTLRRGLFQPGPVVLSYLDPLGLTEISRRISSPATVLVYPRPLGVQLEPLLGGDLLGSERTARSRGAVDGSDFFGLRAYRPGDEWRRVHWPTTARVGALMVIEREALASLSIAVVIDLAAASGDDQDAPLEVLIRLAAQIAEDAIRRMCRLHLLVLTPEGVVKQAAQDVASLDPVLEALARLDLQHSDDLAEVGDLTEVVGRGPSLVVLCENLNPRVGRLVDEIKRNSWPGAVIVLSDDQSEPISLPVWRVRRVEGQEYDVEPIGRFV